MYSSVEMEYMVYSSVEMEYMVYSCGNGVHGVQFCGNAFFVLVLELHSNSKSVHSSNHSCMDYTTK